MELERWAELSTAVSGVAVNFKPRPRDTHPTALIVRVYLWAVLHDRPTSWACEPKHWTPQTCPSVLPDQSTMSRRTRRDDFETFMGRVGQRLNGNGSNGSNGSSSIGGGGGGGGPLVKVIDGKALELPNHTTDPDATWGRGVSRMSVGYKLHAIYSAAAAAMGNPMPDAFVITTLNTSEKDMAARMVARLSAASDGRDGGYLLADAGFDASWLFDYCHHHGYQLVCPRAKPGTDLGHRYVSPHRRRAIEMLEPVATANRFGTDLYATRPDIERNFAQLTSFGGGLAALPSWVRRIWRVRNWVTGKLLVNAARIRINRRSQALTAVGA
jgi:hypothetical protein